MTESQQTKRGWFSTWREQRRIRRQQVLESRLPRHEHGSEFGGYDDRSAYRHSAYGHSGPAIYGFGGDGGGCGGDGGGGC
jgi:hypothetical protein